MSSDRWHGLNDQTVPQETKSRAASHLRGTGPSLPDVPRAVHELLARRACLSEVQVLGGLADELFERIIRRALEEAWAKGRGELKQTQATVEVARQVRPDMTATDALVSVEMVRRPHRF